MKNSYYKLLFLSLFITVINTSKNTVKVPSYISDDYNTKFLKGLV